MAWIDGVKPLTLSASSIAEGAADGTLIGTLSGMTAGEKIKLSDSAGGKVRLDGANLVVANFPTIAGSRPTSVECEIFQVNSGARTPYGRTRFKLQVVQAALPVASSKPTIAGNAAYGEILTATDAISTGTFIGRQWLSAGAAIPGAYGATHRVRRSDIGSRIVLRNFFRTQKGVVTVDSEATAVVTLLVVPATETFFVTFAGSPLTIAGSRLTYGAPKNG